MLLKGKKILIMGIRNKWSIAWGAAVSAYEQGAEIIFTYNSESNKPKIEKLMEEIPGSKAYSCDASSNESIKKCSERRAVPIPNKEKRTYIEASMIKWFEPEYNIEYKKAFPKRNQSSYASIYTQDLNNVCFEIDLSRLNIYLYSDKQPASNYIMGRFPLDKNRKDMFSIPMD